MGETAVPTGSQGGTMGWMSPEEIAWDNGGSACGVPFEAHLSGDIHTAGSIIFYILSGGRHCFGSVGYKQQAAISEDRPVFDALADDSIAIDLVARMVRHEPSKRLTIAQVKLHPMFWSCGERIEKIRGWKTSWRRGRDLDRRLSNHPGSVRHILADRGARGEAEPGWLSALDTPVVARLTAREDSRYDGRDVLDLIRAIRNVFEHWFEHTAAANSSTAHVLAVKALTGWDDAEMRRGHASADAQSMRAAAVCRYFLSEAKFGKLLLVFAFPKAWDLG